MFSSLSLTKTTEISLSLSNQTSTSYIRCVTLRIYKQKELPSLLFFKAIKLNVIYLNVLYNSMPEYWTNCQFYYLMVLAFSSRQLLIVFLGIRFPRWTSIYFPNFRCVCFLSLPGWFNLWVSFSELNTENKKRKQYFVGHTRLWER